MEYFKIRKVFIPELFGIGLMRKLLEYGGQDSCPINAWELGICWT